VSLEHLSLKDPRLDSDAEKIVERPELFAARYGNMFVRGLGRGGIFVGAFRLDVTSETDREQISAELEGSYGIFSASAKGKFAEVRSKYQSDALVRMYHEGGPIDLHIQDPTDPTHLLENANLWLDSFKNDPAHAARPYFVTLAPIIIASGPLPPKAQRSPGPRQPAAVRHRPPRRVRLGHEPVDNRVAP
jgi:hypothetical protein